LARVWKRGGTALRVTSTCREMSTKADVHATPPHAASSSLPSTAMDSPGARRSEV